MPGYVKIGITEGVVEQRMLGLYSTGVPLPFECYYAGVVDDPKKIEKALQTAFDHVRVNPKREFFEIDPHQAKVILELVASAEVTPKDEVVESAEDEAALVKARKPFRFSQANVPVGATLVFGREQSETAEVVDDKTIMFRGEPMSLSAAALIILRELGYQWSSVQGPAEWLYQNKSLTELRDEAAKS